jgi:hypothetical protein
MPFKDLEKKVLSGDKKFAEKLVKSFYAGDAYVFTGVLPSTFVRQLIDKVHSFGQRVPAGSHPIIDGCPNFHAIIDKKIGPADGYTSIGHAYYFWPWNKDELGIFEKFRSKWSIVKLVSGLDKDSFTKNIPSDLKIDKVQFSHYPAGAGVITTHADPYGHQKIIFGCELTTYGKDYRNGGLYMMKDPKTKYYIEEGLSPGSFVSAFSSIYHGVDVVDPGFPVDWSSKEGRWQMSPFTIDSHYVEKRWGALAPGKKPDPKRIKMA